MIHKNLSLDELPSLLKDVLDYWRGHGGDELHFSWKNFRLDQLSFSVLPCTMVFDVMPDISKNLFRYCGTGMMRIHDCEMTGKTISEINPPELAKSVFGSHTKTVLNRVASASIYGFERAGGFAHMQYVLRLPLSDDGNTVDQIVTVVDLTDKGLAELEKNSFHLFDR